MTLPDHSVRSRLSGADTVVLCVHGIQGSPDQFDWLVETIPDRIDHLCILLPGHGKTTREFSAVSWREWLDHVVDVYRDLSSRYSRIIYVGHSMGCLLGIIAATETAAWDSMLLLACPLKLRPTIRYFSNNMKSLGRPDLSDPFVCAAWNANSVRANSAFSYLSCLKPYLGLLRLIHMTKAKLNEIPVPMTVLHSEYDEIVSARSLQYFSNCERAKTGILPDSGHFYYTPEAREMVIDSLRSCCDRHIDGGVRS